MKKGYHHKGLIYNHSRYMACHIQIQAGYRKGKASPYWYKQLRAFFKKSIWG